MTSGSTYALILAGGAGTRFWPASRMLRPKQLLPLAGDVPLLRATALRVLPIAGGWERITIATGRHLLDATRAVLPEVPEENFFAEPEPRNTAPCIAWGTGEIAARDADASVMVLPSDHFIADMDTYRRTVESAISTAKTGLITTIGISPTHPETGFGYIERGDDLGLGTGARKAIRFVEKPDLERAKELVASGRFLWNAGMFFFRASDMSAAIKKHLPGCAPILDARGASAHAIFHAMPSISIDHGVMEKLAELAVIPGDFGWSDIGSWRSAHDLATKDERGNSAPEGTILVDARDNHVVDLRASSEKKRAIALVGTEGLVVVETDDALLVIPRERAQDVKAVVDALKARGDADLT